MATPNLPDVNMLHREELRMTWPCSLVLNHHNTGHKKYIPK
jgi:hypothetical protein